MLCFEWNSNGEEDDGHGALQNVHGTAGHFCRTRAVARSQKGGFTSTGRPVLTEHVGEAVDLLAELGHSSSGSDAAGASRSAGSGAAGRHSAPVGSSVIAAPPNLSAGGHE